MVYSIFRDEFIANASNIRSVLDYNVNITKLPPNDQYYVALTGNFRKYDILSVV